MLTVYLSPSLQDWNQYVDGGNEAYYMNLIAEAIIPYLEESGITVVRNHPKQTLSQIINQSNEENYDLHFSIHSNSAPSNNTGDIKGADFYYYPSSTKGKKAAETIARNYTKIYSNKIRMLPTTGLGEVRLARAPSVLAQIGYHDNPEEAQWIRDNIDEIAENLAQGITEYLGVVLINNKPKT